MLIDLHSYDGLLFLIVAWFGYLVLSIYIHELGHLAMLKSLGYKDAVITMKKIDFQAGEDYMYKHPQANKIYWAGIIGGLPPILLFTIIGTWYFNTLLIIVYLSGCTNDFQQLLK